MKTDAAAIDSKWLATMAKSSQKPVVTSSGADILASINAPDDTVETTIPVGKLTGYYCACKTTSDVQVTAVPTRKAV
ncbi:MAG: hypothetical protein Q9227_003178 [Pyrenula ochraceoflavens]